MRVRMCHNWLSCLHMLDMFIMKTSKRNFYFVNRYQPQQRQWTIFNLLSSFFAKHNIVWQEKLGSVCCDVALHLSGFAALGYGYSGPELVRKIFVRIRAKFSSEMCGFSASVYSDETHHLVISQVSDNVYCKLFIEVI